MIVADTNVLSEPLRSVPDPRVLAWLAEHGGEIALTSIAVGELLYGAQRLPAGRRRDDLMTAIDALISASGDRLLTYDTSAARQYAEVCARREAAGHAVSVEDTMIAAICLAGDHTLATRNTRDFTDAGIVLLNPWEG